MALDTPISDNSFELLHHDAPQEVVDLVIDNLHDEQLAISYTSEQWDEFTRDKPHFRDYISRAAFEVAPDDINLRQRVTQALLGLYAVARESKVVEVLEERLQTQDINLQTPETTGSFYEIVEESILDVAEPTKKRLFRREKQPKVRGLHRSIAASALLAFGVRPRSTKSDDASF